MSHLDPRLVGVAKGIIGLCALAFLWREVGAWAVALAGLIAGVVFMVRSTK